MTLDDFLSAGGICESLGTTGDWSSFKFELVAPKGKTFLNGKTFMLAVSMSGVKERLAAAKLVPAFGYFKKAVAA
jgi:hypothetical protein